MCVCVCVYVCMYVKLANMVEGCWKAPFSIAAIPICRVGRYAFHSIAPLYP